MIHNDTHANSSGIIQWGTRGKAKGAADRSCQAELFGDEAHDIIVMDSMMCTERKLAC